MKANPFHLPAIATLAVATVLTGSAFARGGDDDGNDDSPTTDTAKFEAADTDASGGLTLEEFTTTFSGGTRASKILEKFNKADTSNDDSVSLAEWLVYKDDTIPENENDDTAKFNAADANSDGSLTLDEFATTLAGKKPLIEIRARFLRADTNDDDLVSLAEWNVYKNDSLPDDSSGRPRKFDLADLNGDDSLTPDEFAGVYPSKTKPGVVMKKFDKYDRDDSGTLTRDEWNPGKRGGS